LPKIRNDGTTEALLQSLVDCVNDANTLISSYCDQNWMKKIIMSGTNQEKFIEINVRLENISQDLQLGISIKMLFDREQEKRDEEKDRMQIESKLDMILERLQSLDKIEKQMEYVVKIIGTLENNRIQETGIAIVDAINRVKNRPKDLTSIMISEDKIKEKKMIGRGAYGDVYEGTFDGAPVAIKKILADFRHDKEVFESFVQEISIMRYSTHTIGEFVC
jgi:hypothetical protein